MRSRLAVLALLILGACEAPTAPSDRDLLNQARDRWTSSRIVSYVAEYNRGCFCKLADRRMIVTVRDGAVSSAEYLDSGDAVDLALLTYIPTVVDLFDQIEQALDEHAASFFADYDPTYGYPTRIEIDPSATIADDDVTFSIHDLRILTDSR